MKTGAQIAKSLCDSARHILARDTITPGDISDVNTIMYAASYCFRADLRNVAIVINTLPDGEEKIDSITLKQLQTYL